MSEDYTPQVGDKVRVVLEGEVTYVTTDGNVFDIDDSSAIVTNGESAVSVERVAEPLPEFGTGAVVMVYPYLPFLRVARPGNLNGVWTGAGVGGNPGNDEIERLIAEAHAEGTLEVLYQGNDPI